MATKNEGGSVKYILQWVIENISQAWWLEKEHITSPTLIVDELKGTKWSLGFFFLEESGINFYLHREEDCSGPFSVELEYELAILGKDGSILGEDISEENFVTNAYSNFLFLEAQNEIFYKDRENIFPEDTLTVQCTLQKPENEVREGQIKSKHLYSQTVLKVIRTSFDCRIENFSTLQPGLIKELKEDLFEFGLFFLFSGKGLRINIIPFHDSIKYISCNTSTINSEGKKESWGIDRRIFGKDFQEEKLLSSVMKFEPEFLENKNRNFPNDVLSLDFDVVLSPGEHSEWRMYSEKDVQQQKDENTTALIQDFESLYIDPSSSDMKLLTSDKIIPVHKAILIARSPVFRKMLSHDMKEKESREVVIEDLDSDTVQRMLLFMHTSKLEGMTFESASKLYKAADKYEIVSLKSSCSAFLKDALCPDTILPALLLADQHQNVDLENAVYDYILEHRRYLGRQEGRIFHGQKL